MFGQPFAVPALLLFIVSVPLILGVIPRNRYYGFRVAKTLSDDGIWYRANRVAGVTLMITSGVYVFVAIAWPYDRAAIDNFSTWLVHLAGFATPLAVGLIIDAWYVKSL